MRDYLKGNRCVVWSFMGNARMYQAGGIFAIGDPIPIHMESTNDDAFEIVYRLEVPVREDIYDYIKGE